MQKIMDLEWNSQKGEGVAKTEVTKSMRKG